MNKTRLISLFAAALALTLSLVQAQPTLIAIGSLTQSRAGANADLSGLTHNLENGTPANLLGGLDSAIAYDSGKKSLLLPDRGPNAVTFDDAIDSTVSLRRSRGLSSVRTSVSIITPGFTRRGFQTTTISCCRPTMCRRYLIRTSFLYLASRMTICLAMCHPRMGCHSGTS